MSSLHIAETLSDAHPLLHALVGGLAEVDDFVNVATKQLGVAELSESTGIALDQLKYVICLMLAYPLALLHRSLPNSPALKHFFAGATGFAMGLFCFGSGMIHSVITSLVTYLIVLTVRGPAAPMFVFVFTLAHLSISHLVRQLEDYGGYTLDYTGPQMILIMKLTSFAFNVYDGHRKEEIPKDFKERALYRVPSPLEFFGFVYFFGGFLAGPAVEMREYLEFTNLALFPKDPETGKRRIPASYWAAARVFFCCLVCYAMTIVKGMYPVFYIRDAGFLAMPFLVRFLYVQFSVNLHRFQYYFVWLLAEGACILSGLGYSGTDEKGVHQWSRCSNVDIIALETSQNFKSITDSWNKKTNLWLKYYIYLRLTPASGKPTTAATFLTYLTSAFWHGFYPGYYLTFFTGAFMTTLARSLRQKLRPRFMVDEKTPKLTKPLYDLVSWLVTVIMLNYICAAFVLLDLNDAYRLYASLFFVGHVGALLTYAVVSVMKAPKKADAKPKAS